MNPFAQSWIFMALCGLVCAAEPPENPIQARLFPPELVMQHLEELGLTEQQMAGIRGHLEKAGAEAAEVQKKLHAATQKLGDLLGKEAVDEAAVLKQLDEVLQTEREMKRLHLQVMIRIKNELTAKQQQ